MLSFQLNKFISNVETSYALNEKSNKLPKKEILEQKKLIKKWSLIDERLSKLTHFEISAPKFLKKNILELQSDCVLNYTEVITKLSKEAKKSGRMWLYGISKSVRDVLSSELD